MTDYEKFQQVFLEIGVDSTLERFNPQRFELYGRPESCRKLINVGRTEYCFDEAGGFLGLYRYSASYDRGLFYSRIPTVSQKA